MKKKELNFAQSTALSWYNLDPLFFDTASNNDWLMLYMKKWLGCQYNNEPFMRQRMSKMPYESFRRAVQWLIQHDYIKLSQENMRKRKRSEAQTRDTILQNPHPMKHLVFLTDSMGRKSETWI